MRVRPEWGRADEDDSTEGDGTALGGSRWAPPSSAVRLVPDAISVLPADLEHADQPDGKARRSESARNLEEGRGGGNAREAGSDAERSGAHPVAERGCGGAEAGLSRGVSEYSGRSSWDSLPGRKAVYGALSAQEGQSHG